MVPPGHSKPFLPLYDTIPATQSRDAPGLSASIWAPQPQKLKPSSWPEPLDTPHQLAGNANFPFISREDLFPPEPAATRPKEIGAIGDGRKKALSDLYDTHNVEQMLRTLHLVSPAPFASAPKPPLTLDLTSSPKSPDFSPASVSSALLTPTDLSPPKSFDVKVQSSIEPSHSFPYLHQSSLLFDQNYTSNAQRQQEPLLQPSSSFTSTASFSQLNATPTAVSASSGTFEPFAEPPTPAPQPAHTIYHSQSHSALNQLYSSPRQTLQRRPSIDWRLSQLRAQQEQFQQQQVFQLQQQISAVQNIEPRRLSNEKPTMDFSNLGQSPIDDFALRPAFNSQYHRPTQSHSQSFPGAHEPINFLSLLHPSSSPPYDVFVQPEAQVADGDERAKIVDAICMRGFEMMAHRFGNWAVQRCLEAASTPDERRKIVSCMKGRIVELATNCYGCHVLQKALDCEEDIRLLIVSELLVGDPAQTLVNKHASHVWSKIMELSWTPPAPPIFTYVNKSLKGKWASLACHETGSLVVQHAFENLEEEAKDGIVDELLNQGHAIFSEVTKNQWGAYCVQHILEHGSEKHRRMTLDHLLEGLLEFATNEQGSKSVMKALKEGGKDTLNKVVKRMCEPAKGARRAMIVDMALSPTGSQLIASVLPTADKDQRGLLYDCIKGHIVTLRGCKTGSKVIWLFDRMVREALVLMLRPHPC
ncbi:armadillo-type protein [Cyathus striatus]|nr:armadillo-type protein [Cyathus striatus]